MNSNILIIQPVYDEATELQAEGMLDFVLHNDLPDFIDIYILYGKNANRENFLKYYYILNPKMVVFGGHGDYDAIYSSENSPIITKDDLHLFIDRIVYSFNCNFGKTLAESKYQSAFLGYTSDYIIDSENPDVSVSVGLYPIYFLGHGYTVFDSYRLTIENYKHFMNKYKFNYFLYHSLKNNMNAFIISGNVYTKLY